MLILHHFFSHGLSHFDDKTRVLSLFTHGASMKLLHHPSSRSVRLFLLAALVTMLPSCQSAIRFSSSVKGNTPSSAAIASSSTPKSHASSSHTSSNKAASNTISKSSILLSASQERLLTAAERWLGTPYRYGSTTRTGTDCSGFVMRVYEETGINIPRSTKDQFTSGIAVEREELSIGDLLFFNTNGVGVSHVGIYAGADTVIHASSTYGVVKQSFSDTYLAKTFVGARRMRNQE